MRHVVMSLLCLHVAGCGVLIDEDFEGYTSEDELGVEAPAAPDHCNPANPHDASGEFVQCALDETCQFTLPDGSPDPTLAAPRCVSTYDWKPTGSACTYANECGPGAGCSPVTGCRQFCSLETPSCDSGQECLPIDGGATAEGQPIGLCAPPPCDPVASSCSGTCGFYEPNRTACFLDTGTGELGQACNSDTDCEAGLGCDDAAKHCTPYCRIGQADCGDKECIAVNQPPLSYAGVSYGYCAL